MMTTRRKIIVYIATSADGYIARPDGDVEWLNRRPDTVDYGMRTFYRTIDAILWGRGTYDWLLNYSVYRHGNSTRRTAPPRHSPSLTLGQEVSGRGRSASL